MQREVTVRQLSGEMVKVFLATWTWMDLDEPWDEPRAAKAVAKVLPLGTVMTICCRCFLKHFALLEGICSADADAYFQQTQAIKDCDAAQVDELLTVGQRPSLVRLESNTHSPLQLACQQGNSEVVKLLLQANADVASFAIDEMSPLQIAAKHGHVEVARCLVEAKALLHDNRRGHCSPLQIASERGHVKVVRLLILAGDDPDCNGRYGRTPLQLACERGDLEMVRLLLRSGADINQKSTCGGTPLQIAAEKGHLELILGGCRMPR
eukprot:Skav231966  [mRNA]  locus=scaffold2806:277333:290231:+ [translate_table: standard]